MRPERRGTVLMKDKLVQELTYGWQQC